MGSSISLLQNEAWCFGVRYLAGGYQFGTKFGLHWAGILVHLRVGFWITERIRGKE